MMDLIRRTLEDEEKTEASIKLSIGLIGDLADTYPTGQIKEYLLSDWVAVALKTKSRLNPETRKTVRWAREVCLLFTPRLNGVLKVAIRW